MAKIITEITLKDWKKLCPYGKWTRKDGSEVLFNRSYWPILERGGDGEEAAAANPGEWIEHVASCHFFTDWDCPWRNPEHGMPMTPSSEQAMARVNRVLRAWGVPELVNPPLRRGPPAELRIFSAADILNTPIPPRENLWVRYIEQVA